MSVTQVNYIRVDHKRNIFQATDPGVALVDSRGLTKHIVLQAKEEKPALKALENEKIKVYKLKTPVQPLPDRPPGFLEHMTRLTAEQDAKDKEIRKAFAELEAQIKEKKIGIMITCEKASYV